MLNIDRNAEVAIHAQAADIEWTLVRRGQNNWLMTIEGATDAGIAEGDTGRSEPQLPPRPVQEFVLNDAQASATMALWIGDDAIPSEEVVNALYEIAEQVWRDVPLNFRPIP